MASTDSGSFFDQLKGVFVDGLGTFVDAEILDKFGNTAAAVRPDKFAINEPGQPSGVVGEAAPSGVVTVNTLLVVGGLVVAAGLVFALARS